ncbi:MAG: ABC transporter permease [Rhodospirillales bacterium]|nr:ABC transporter permease [Rhodospirillales bacterium]
MTTSVITNVDTTGLSRPGWFSRALAGNALPVLIVSIAIIIVWYAATIYMNATMQVDQFERAEQEWSYGELVAGTMSQERPLLPAPHQVIAEMTKTIFGKKITSKRSLVYHSWVTLSSTLLGFAAGGLLGVLLATGIVHSKALEKSLLPWIISSQTIPILAIAPMVIVVLGAVGFKGLVPKAMISMYLGFFPVAISMVKGLRSPDVLQMDLLRTYNASRIQVFGLLRWPSSMPFLFASLKIAVAISLIGSIVGELPTGAQAGLGARLLAGSYYGQTIQIWSALFMAAFLSACLVGLIGVVERIVLHRMGARQ